MQSLCCRIVSTKPSDPAASACGRFMLEGDSGFCCGDASGEMLSILASITFIFGEAAKEGGTLQTAGEVQRDGVKTLAAGFNLGD